MMSMECSTGSSGKNLMTSLLGVSTTFWYLTTEKDMVELEVDRETEVSEEESEETVLRLISILSDLVS